MAKLYNYRYHILYTDGDTQTGEITTRTVRKGKLERYVKSIAEHGKQINRIRVIRM